MIDNENNVHQRWANWLRGQLEAQGKMQKWLAEQIGVGPDRISSWLAGRDRANPDNALRVAEAFGVEPQEALRAAGWEEIADSMPGGEEAVEEAPPYRDDAERVLWEMDEPEPVRRALIDLLRRNPSDTELVEWIQALIEAKRRRENGGRAVTA